MAKRKSGVSKKSGVRSAAYMKKLSAAVGIFAAGSVIGAEVDFSSLSPYFELAVPVKTEVSVSDESHAETKAEYTADVFDDKYTPTETEARPIETEVPIAVVTPEIPTISENENAAPSEDISNTTDTAPTTDYDTIFDELSDGANTNDEAVKSDDVSYDDWMEAIFVPSGEAEQNNGSENVTDKSSMTDELAGMLENIAVFWTPNGEKIHLDPECRSVGDVVFAGTLEEARNVRGGGWCKWCAEHLVDTDNATFYVKGNVLATYESLISSYTYDDYLNKIPRTAFDG